MAAVFPCAHCVLENRGPDPIRNEKPRPARFKKRLLEPVEGLLQNLPVFQALELLLVARVDFGFELVLGRTSAFVKNPEIARESRIRQLVGGDLVRDIVVRRDGIEYSAFAWIRRIKRAIKELDAFA